jgi:hypothetical protein
MLTGETVAVYCENHTEHTDTVRNSQETHYVSATKTYRLRLCRGHSRCLLREPYETHNTVCGAECRAECRMYLKAGGTHSNRWALKA